MKKRYFPPILAILASILFILSLCKPIENGPANQTLLILAGVLGAAVALTLMFNIYVFVGRIQKKTRESAEQQAQALTTEFQQIVEDNQKCKEAYIKANYVFSICCLLPQMEEEEKAVYLKKNKDKIVSTLNEVEVIYNELEEREEIFHIIDNIRKLLKKQGI